MTLLDPAVHPFLVDLLSWTGWTLPILALIYVVGRE